MDNQLPTATNSLQAALGNLDQRGLLQTRLAGGQRSLVLRVSGVENVENDPDVRVVLYDAYALEADCTRLSGGSAMLAVAQRSLRDRGVDIDRDATQVFAGRIENGWLTATGSARPVRLPWIASLSGTMMDIILQSPRLRMQLLDGGARVGGGSIGGFMNGSEAAAGLHAVCSRPATSTTDRCFAWTPDRTR